MRRAAQSDCTGIERVDQRADRKQVLRVPSVGLMSTPGVRRVSSIRTRRQKQANHGMEGNPVEARPLRIA